MTPLNWAAWQGQQAAASVLFANGADVNLSDKYKRTPLDRAISDHKSNMTNYLRSVGALTYSALRSSSKEQL